MQAGRRRHGTNRNLNRGVHSTLHRHRAWKHRQALAGMGVAGDDLDSPNISRGTIAQKI